MPELLKCTSEINSKVIWNVSLSNDNSLSNNIPDSFSLHIIAFNLFFMCLRFLKLKILCIQNTVQNL